MCVYIVSSTIDIYPTDTVVSVGYTIYGSTLLYSHCVISIPTTRELSWHDVAFYNADLYEGLRRMIRDVESDKNSAEDFHATYCCFFEVSMYGFYNIHHQ